MHEDAIVLAGAECFEQPVLCDQSARYGRVERFTIGVGGTFTRTCIGGGMDFARARACRSADAKRHGYEQERHDLSFGQECATIARIAREPYEGKEGNL